MKNENKNIDHIIANKLKGYESIPPTEVWDGISQGLGTKSKKLFLLPFWRIAAGIAILLGVGLTYLLIDHPEQLAEENKITENNYSEPSFTDSKISGKINKETSNEEQKIKSIPEQGVSKTTEINQGKIADKKDNIKSTQYIAEENVESDSYESDLGIIYTKLTAENFPYQKELIQPDDKIISSVKNKIIASWDVLQENITDEEVQAKDKFFLTASMSPLYSYRDIGGSSSENFNNAESGKISYSGGVQFGIRQNKKLSFQTGLYYSRLGIGIDDIYAFNSVYDFNEVNTFNNTYIASNSIGQIKADKQKEIVYSSNRAETDMMYATGSLQTEAPTSTDAQLDQYFHVLEVPFLARYTIIDRALNVNVLCGLSTNFIIGNEVYINDGDSEFYFGKTGSINTVNYSGNLGLGFDYEMNKNFLFSIEPIFKYYLNSINSENLINARPYNFGFYTGIRYIF